MVKKYLPKEIEGKWQKKWLKDAVYSPDLESAKKPYYALMMFPYPSAEGLHVGNMYAFTGADIHARFMRMQGYDVFEPIGLDGFGIHSENYALKIGKHPVDQSKVNEKRFYEQLKSIGNSFDWSRTVETYKPEYYKWTQWLFLKMYKAGLAYRTKAAVNWCPSCKTVLADEQVIAEKCERCSTTVTKKELEQWFFKITEYADKLLKNLDDLDWSEKVKIAQRNWIGRSEGLEIEFKVIVGAARIDKRQTSDYTGGDTANDSIIVFTTRPETIDGATFIAIAPDHPLAKSKKINAATGIQVTNPVTRKKIPVWVADYVLSDYGTGAIMCVPFADERDREFAKKHKLPNEETKFDAEPQGKKKINYHLRDWLISRQRYWGPPIPIIYCDKCGTVPVPEKDLPVELPYVKNFQPKGTGKSPLSMVEEFYKVECPKCHGKARRETDVSDTFLDSAWYFFRYTSIEDKTCPWMPERVKKWLPVNMYIGGAEHSVLHLLYARFISMAFKDMKLISHFEEPFTKFRALGMLISQGAKMSKSRGNVITPDKYIKEYGADTLRMYLMFLGPFEQGGDFRDEAIGGVYRFLHRVWQLQFKVKDAKLTADDQKIMHKTIKRVTEDIENLRYNTAIAAQMEWINHLSRKPSITSDELRVFLLLLAPFAPHITEEMWFTVEGLAARIDKRQTLDDTSGDTANLKRLSIHLEEWPKYEAKYLSEANLKIPVQVDGKLRGLLIVKAGLSETEIVKKALEIEPVNRHVAGRTYKIVYVKDRILNFITE